MGFVIDIFIALAVLFIIYILMIMPALRKKPLSAELMEQRVYAHRGLYDNSGDAPENSLAAFRKAVEAGYGMEMDVQLTKDRIPVIFHDNTLQRVCGAEGRISDYTYEELQQFHLCNSEERIPTLAQVLEVVGGRTPLIVEFKTETHDVSVCKVGDELLRRYEGKYCVESFNPLAVLWYRRKRPEVVRGQLSDCFLKGDAYKSVLHWMLQNLLFDFIGKPDFVAYNCLYPKVLSRRICHRVFRNMAFAWTVKSPEQMENLKDEFDVFIFEGFRP